MAEQMKWQVTEEVLEEEAPSLTDLAVISDHDHHKKRSEYSFTEFDRCADPEEFEFHTIDGGEGDLVFTVAELDMCAADEVFFQGQILPFRPSVSPSNNAAGAAVIKLKDIRLCNSLSRQSSSELSSLGFTSSGSISRSHSSGSSTSTSNTPPLPPPSMKVSTNSLYYYSHPSPSPQLRRSSKSMTPGRRSTGSAPPAGWPSLLRLGVVKTPEIELHDLHSRCAAAGNAKLVGAKEGETKKKEKWLSRMRFLGFACNCSPETVDVDVPAAKIEIQKKKRSKEEKIISCLQRKHDQQQKRRVCEWLDELPITKF